MGTDTLIEWAHHTFNPWIGCSKVSPGCQHCYAETLMDKRMGKAQWGDHGTRVRTSAANWKHPLKWNRDAAAQGIRYRVFCASLADVFEDRPELKPWRIDLLDLIFNTPNLDWLLLTKRPENIMPMLAPMLKGCNMIRFPHNLWLGTSVENQEQADKRIPELLKVPATVRFLSCEPLLAPVDLTRIPNHDDFMRSSYIDALSGQVVDTLFGRSGNSIHYAHIHWVICGGESGPQARPMHPDWARSLRDQCHAAGVPFLFKQWGEWAESEFGRDYPDSIMWGNLHTDGFFELRTTTALPRATWNKDAYVVKVGKKAAGRTLDGQIHNAFPEVLP